MSEPWSRIQSPRAWFAGLALRLQSVLVAAGLLLSGAARASAATCQRMPIPKWALTTRLHGVSVTSSRNAWAVGYYDTHRSADPDPDRALERQAWKIQASPNLPPGSKRASSLASPPPPPTNAWAVGYVHEPERDRWRTLIEHWNGKAWKIQASPKLRGLASALRRGRHLLDQRLGRGQ